MKSKLITTVCIKCGRTYLELFTEVTSGKEGLGFAEKCDKEPDELKEIICEKCSQGVIK